MQSRLWLLDVGALDDQGSPTTLRFSNGEWMGEEYYEPRLKQAGLFTEGLFSGGILPSSRSSFGITQIINNDGALDYLVDYAFDGREVRLDFFDGTTRKNAFIGSVQRAQYSRNMFELRLRSPSEPFSVRREFETYAGDNTPPDGLEGNEDGIKGTPKPRLYGEVRNFNPVLVNEQKLIYQVSDLSDCIIEDVYDEGFTITKGSDYNSLIELESVQPNAGEWRSFEGYFRLGSALVGQVTVDAGTSDNRLGEVFEKIVNEVGYSLTECKDELNAFGNVRMIATDRETYISMLDQLAQSAGAYWRVTPEGYVEAGLIPTPSSPITSIEQYSITNISRSSSGAGRNGVPIWRVEVEADRIEELQQDVAGAVAEERVARLSKRFRKSFAEDVSVKERHRLSEVWELESSLSSLTNASTVADNILNLLSVRRDDVSVDISIDSDALDVPLLSTVTLTTTRLGYSEGRDMLVVGKTFNPVKNTITFSLWG